MKQQGKALFYINRKLASNDVKQILQGIREARTFINTNCNLQFLNTVVVSLLDLFCTAKISYIRIETAIILQSCRQFINDLSRKPQIISILTKQKCLKSHDELTRILSLQIIQQLHNLFHRDTSLFHYLLSRIKFRKQFSTKQQIRTVQILSKILQNSQHLSNIFSNNISQLYQIGGIQKQILVYLSINAEFGAEEYVKVLSELTAMDDNQKDKKYQKLMDRFIVKACRWNYRCVVEYFREYRNRFHLVEQKVRGIARNYYSFIGKDFINDSNTQNISCEDFLDVCYLQFQYNDQISFQLRQKILQKIENTQITPNFILFLFYLPNSHKKYLQNKIISHLSTLLSTNTAQNLLKMSITCGAFDLSLSLCNIVLNKIQENQVTPCVIMLQTYAQMHVNAVQENLSAFFCVFLNLCKCYGQQKLEFLIKKWKQIHFKGEDNEYLCGDGDGGMGQTKGKNKVSCQQEIERINNGNLIGVPISLREQNYSGIYFGKKTILQMFKCFRQI